MPGLSQNLEFVVNSTSTVSISYPNTGTTMMTYYSVPAKGDGYYGSSDGIHTVSYVSSPEFVGTITMQASLASTPSETDWFTVLGAARTYTSTQIRTTSTVDYANFTGNFVWVRGYVRITQGAVEVIHYNH